MLVLLLEDTQKKIQSRLQVGSSGRIGLLDDGKRELRNQKKKPWNLYYMKMKCYTLSKKKKKLNTIINVGGNLELDLV